MPFDWDKLRIFHAVAEVGSFTHGGEKLALSQSAASRQISALERDLKVPLFHRHARGLLLTEQGEILYRTTRDIETRLRGVQSKLIESSDKPAGELRVTTTPGLGAVWLAPKISEFTERYPDIRLTFMLTDEELDLSMLEADVAIRMHPPTQPSLVQRKLVTVHFHAYASKAYLEKYGTPKDFKDLDNHRILVLGGTASHHLNRITWLQTVARAAKEPRQPSILINTVFALKLATESGNGIAVLPDYITEGSEKLVRVFDQHDIPGFDTYFVYPEELRHSLRVTAFRDFLIEKTKGWSY